MKYKFDVTVMIKGAVSAFMGARGEPDHEIHNRLVDVFNRTNLTDYDYGDLFRLSGYLERVIMTFRYAWEDADKSVSNGKLESLFNDEITLLKKIAEMTQYSPRLYGWAAECHANFIDAIYEPEFYQRRLAWADMDIDERQACIVELMQKQAEAYSMGAIPLITPELKLFGTKGNAEGYVELNKNMDENRPSSVPVWLASDMFVTQPTYKMAMLRAYHEMIHHITLQLAVAVKDGRIGPDHPLYDDAVMKLERITNSAHIHGDITPVYAVDGEENLAYEQEFQLYQSCISREKKLSPP